MEMTIHEALKKLRSYALGWVGESGNDEDEKKVEQCVEILNDWIICWERDTVSGIFPKGSKAGLTHDGEENGK